MLSHSYYWWTDSLHQWMGFKPTTLSSKGIDAHHSLQGHINFVSRMNLSRTQCTPRIVILGRNICICVTLVLLLEVGSTVCDYNLHGPSTQPCSLECHSASENLFCGTLNILVTLSANLVRAVAVKAAPAAAAPLNMQPFGLLFIARSCLTVTRTFAQLKILRPSYKWPDTCAWYPAQLGF